MSYFAFGEALLKAGIDEKRIIEVSIDLTRQALQEEIFVLVGPCIVQKFIFEILNEQRTQTADALTMPFLITSSPMSDTSHELLALPNLLPKTHDEWVDALRQNLEKMVRLLGWLLELREVRTVTVFLSEGYDISYDLVETQSARMVERIIEKCGEDFDIPSLKLILSRQAGTQP